MTSRCLPMSAAPDATLAALTAARSVALCGEEATALSLQVAARMAAAGRSLTWICGDNVFNPYTVAQAAVTLDASPEATLRRIQIARAFTAYQLTELVERLTPATQPKLLILSGLCTSFLDEDVTHTDAARLFYRVLWRMVELTEQGMSLLLVQCPVAPSARRAYFYQDMCRVVHRVLYLEGRHSFRLRTQIRNGLLPLLPQSPVTREQ